MLMRPVDSFVRPRVNSPDLKKCSEAEIFVRFWGVRGGIATPGRETARYGGNTACVEVRCGGHTMIFDGGTGLRPLGDALTATGSTVDVDIFFSHFHSDHIKGFPFFAPCYAPTSRLRLWSGILADNWTIERALRTMVGSPFFPLRLDEFKAAMEFHSCPAGETLKPHPDVTVHTAMLNHPGGSLGHRLEFGSCSVAYITDTEHRPGELDPNVLKLARGADLMIYDGNYTDQEFSSRIGWGHSTWEQGVRLANAAAAKTLAIFHHDPAHNDGFLDEISAKAEASRPGTIVAREGLTLQLAPSENHREQLSSRLIDAR